MKTYHYKQTTNWDEVVTLGIQGWELITTSSYVDITSEPDGMNNFAYVSGDTEIIYYLKREF